MRTALAFLLQVRTHNSSNPQSEAHASTEWKLRVRRGTYPYVPSPDWTAATPDSCRVGRDLLEDSLMLTQRACPQRNRFARLGFQLPFL